MSRDLVYLRHIAAAVAKVGRFTRGLDRETFGEQDMAIGAVVRELEVIGEAARNVSPAFREAHPEIPFAAMIGMRNRLIHAYFGVDMDIVWRTCQSDLPVLSKSLATILHESGEGSPGEAQAG